MGAKVKIVLFLTSHGDFSRALSEVTGVPSFVRVYRAERDITAERDQERIEGREALRLLTQEMGEHVVGEITFPHPRFSLSHTGNFRAACGIAASGSDLVTGVGIDLELARPMAERIGKFFLTDEEFASVRPVSGATPDQTLLRLWTVKEAVFKSDPDNAGHVLRHYRVEDATALQGYATENTSGKRFWYCSQPFEGGWLSVAACMKGVSDGSH